MELYEAMRTSPSCRYYTDEPVPAEVLHRVFDNARFASSGGNRQGWRVVVVRDRALRARLAALHQRQWDAYISPAREGVVGHQASSDHTHMASDAKAQRRLDRTDDFARALADVPVLLVACVELWTLAVTDSKLDRTSIVGGASLYTFVQNILLGCRNEGLGTALTTLLAAEEPAVVELLDLPEGVAVGALISVGWPVPEHQYTKLTRKPVEEIAFADRWDRPFTVG